MLTGVVLIISTQGFGDETEHDTNFIVLTKNRHTRYPSGVIGLGLRRLRNGVLFSRTSKFFCDASKVRPAAFIAWQQAPPGAVTAAGKAA
jgi:hypothetical protein